MFDKLAGIEARFQALEGELVEAAGDYQRMADLARERAEIEPIVTGYRDYLAGKRQLEQAEALQDSQDEELRQMAVNEIAEVRDKLETLEARLKSFLLPRDPRDERSVIVEIRAGTGGDEAGLFAADLFRMYSRYAESRRWGTEVLSQSETGIGGFKEIIFRVNGRGAFSRLKYESGVHRVQRVPVTEASGRIHTSTATVAVLAEADEVEIQIPEKDIKMDVYRSAGAGGQNVQKNATAVRLTHLPTGMVVQCQDERSQLQNRTRAMSILRARLYEIAINERQAEEDADRRAQVGSGERSEKIRTYNFPQSRVTDHRIGVSSHNLPAVLSGELDGFIDELATRDEAERLQAARA
ncbi:MAG: peptide chain release factor 1 [Chloroflexi bacterium RBG_13_68_17]|nr:MAG: peptide chain release factor 1 [Chloroflexi bacterium RBG_13_68_17]